MTVQGLSQEEVLKSKKEYGYNKLPEPKQKTALDFFIETFKDKLNLILLGMTIIFVMLAILGHASVIEPIGIAVVLVAISVINVCTGLRSQKNTKILKDKSSVHFCNVLRKEGIEKINTTEVVVGDIVLLQAGEAVCADGFLIEGKIKVNNSVLNGESKDCKKFVIDDFVYEDKKDVNSDDFVDSNSLFSGAIVTEGEGKMLVKKVGIHTVNGQTILTMQNIQQKKTSLELQLEKLAGQISKFGYIGATVITVVILSSQISDVGLDNYLHQGNLLIIKSIFAVLITAITIIVAAVPEGLPLIINLITAQNAKLMLEHNVLAKNTNKIPEAGNIQLLCTDKTGTLTKGVLSPVYNLTLDGSEIKKDGKVFKIFKENIALNTSAMFDADNNIIGGNATDRALLSMITPEIYGECKEKISIVEKLAFNSTNKYSAVEVKENDTRVSYYKGAPEKFLKFAKYYESENGIRAIDFEAVQNKIKEFTTRSMRVVALGYSPSSLDEELPNDLVMLSLVAIRDDIRPEAIEAVKKMHGAGVQVMMITGDVLDTAESIAKEVGLITNKDDIAISAIDLDSLSDEEVKEKLSRIKVIARATPKTKLRIIELAQELNLCVGMTGDGTNDAPALKASDVGFSMGSGTDLCKEAGDIIITDDNFVSITSSVLFGRTFMHNVTKFLKFQLPINISMVILSILFPLFFDVEAVVAVQILAINIVMDALVSLSFGGEPAKAEYMLEKPIEKGSNLFSRETFCQISLSILSFMIIFAITLIPAIKDNFFATEPEYLTARFALLVLIANINGFNIRTTKMNLFEGISKNPMFVEIFIYVLLGTIFAVTFGGKIMQCVPLNLVQWGVILGLSFLIVPLDLIRKCFFRKSLLK